MKNKYIALGLLSLATALGLAACGGTPAASTSNPEGSTSEATTSVESTEKSETTSEATTTEEATSTGEEEIAPTRVKITQPDTVLVGSVIKVKDICTFTPENATLYSLVSDNEEVAEVVDKDTINIVGSGKASIKVTTPNGEKTKTLGTIKITALSEAGIELQAFADQITNTYFIDAYWAYYENNSWDKVTEEDEFKAVEPLAIALTENYVLDWTYGLYSALLLAEDGNTYGYDLLDADGNIIGGEGSPVQNCRQAAMNATGVKVGSRVDPNYLTLYFPIEDLLDVTQWTEAVEDDGDVYFYTDAGAVVVNTLGTLLGMSVGSYSGVHAEIWLNDEGNALEGELYFNDSRDANLCAFSVTIGEDAKIPALEEYAAHGEVPAPTDVSPILDALAGYTDNYATSWEIGLYDNKTYNPIEGYYDSNSLGVTLVDDDTLLYCGLERDAETAQPDFENPKFGGFYTDKEEGGVYLVEVDDDGNFVKGDLVTGSEAVKDPLTAQAKLNLNPTLALTEAVLKKADLTDEGDGNYHYTASFDDLELGYLLSGFSPYSYSGLFDDPENARYCEGSIHIGDDFITATIFERVRITEELSGLQGVIFTLNRAGTIEANLGDNALELFQLAHEVPDEGQGE